MAHLGLMPRARQGETSPSYSAAHDMNYSSSYPEDDILFARTPPTKNFTRLEPIAVHTRAQEKLQAHRAKREKGWVSVYTERDIPGIGAAVFCRCSACKGNGRFSAHRDDGSHAKRAGFRVGDRVLLSGERTGVVRWLGQLDSDFVSNELFVGVQLDDPLGQHNGVYRGKRYFLCPDHHGVFVPQRDVMFVKSRCEIHYKTTGNAPKRTHHVKPIASPVPAAPSPTPAPADPAPPALAAGPSSYTLERLRQAQRRGEEYIRQQRETDEADAAALAALAAAAAAAPPPAPAPTDDAAAPAAGDPDATDAEELARVSELVRQETERIRNSLRAGSH
eukprot:m.127051 g.127051  ORF g.127051 m.127051 type:complete len:334 (-) comp14699_c3_seq1:38-1039(-)